MKKNGYTVIELLVLIVVLGVIACIAIPKMSQAFYTDKEAVYNTDMKYYLAVAEAYGKDNIEEIKKTNDMVISIGDLIKNKYITDSDNGNVRDPRTGATLNNIKIRLFYDEENDKVYAELVS